MKRVSTENEARICGKEGNENEVVRVKKRERPRKIWIDGARKDMEECGVTERAAYDRTLPRKSTRRAYPT